AGQAIGEDLLGPLFMAFHELVLQYDPGRGVMLAGYLKGWLRLELQAAAEHARNAQGSAPSTPKPKDGESPGADPFTEEEGDAEELAAPGDLEQGVIRRLMAQRLLA